MWDRTRAVPGIRRLLVVTVAGTIGAAGLAIADPGVTNVPAHRHFLKDTDGSLVAVGPDLCDNPHVQMAFNQYHDNHHVAPAGSPGPTVPAPGLHNGLGPDIIAKPCSFHAP